MKQKLWAYAMWDTSLYSMVNVLYSLTNCIQEQINKIGQGVLLKSWEPDKLLGGPSG